MDPRINHLRKGRTRGCHRKIGGFGDCTWNTVGRAAKVRTVLGVEVLWGAWKVAECLWFRTSSTFRWEGKNLQYHSLIPHSVENKKTRDGLAKTAYANREWGLPWVPVASCGLSRHTECCKPLSTKTSQCFSATDTAAEAQGFDFYSDTSKLF